MQVEFVKAVKIKLPQLPKNNSCEVISGGVLSYFRSLFGQKELRILILGLDGAGKTTILYRLQVFLLLFPLLVSLLMIIFRWFKNRVFPCI